MLTRTRQFLAFLPIAAAFINAPALGQTEVEPNNTFAQANGPYATGTTIRGTFSSAADSDVFSLVLSETTNLGLAAWGSTIGQCPIMNDPVVYVHDAAGTQIAMIDDNGGLCPSVAPGSVPALTNLAAGVYYLRLEQFGVGSDPNYTLVISSTSPPVPIAESFTYQGSLEDGGAPFTGYKQFQFSLWSHPTRTNTDYRLSLPIQYQAVDVVDGKFTVDLDFTIPNAPPNYDGTERYLQIEIADVGGANSVVLDPRQRLSPTPHAIRAISATTAATATLATSATTAQNAIHATSADYAADAGSASNVIWFDVSSKPAGFADGIDNEGGWAVNSFATWTNNSVAINTNNAGGFDLAVSGTAAKTGGGSWAIFCDERLKHDIEPLTGTLDRLLNLRGYSYEYNADAVENRLALPGTQIGLLAQEVERVFPDWVETDAQGYKYVTERSTTALMVEGLRDLRAEKDAQFESLKAENAELKARLERLERLLNTKP